MRGLTVTDLVPGREGSAIRCDRHGCRIHLRLCTLDVLLKKLKHEGPIMPKTALPATASATAVLATGLLLVSLHTLGPLSAHMALHIALMNVAAPLGAVWLARKPLVATSRPFTAWAVGAIQAVLLWSWHAPSLQRAALQSHALQIVIHASLFLIALWFWRALLRLPLGARWQAIPILLITGKLACLLAVLVIFAPRVLYGVPVGTNAASHHWMSISLEDQQLAGLFMIIACPLSYVVAGVVFAAQAISDLGKMSGTSPAAR